jgi:hypothetical protein
MVTPAPTDRAPLAGRAARPTKPISSSELAIVTAPITSLDRAAPPGSSWLRFVLRVITRLAITDPTSGSGFVPGRCTMTPTRTIS